jgi:imidazole glycerol-phosphate synthase subunit HisH
MIGIVDYGGGNIQSVRNTLTCLGAEHRDVSSPEDFSKVSALVFPGQGAFADSMAGLAARGLVAPLQTWLREDRPFFGICIGYQVLFESSQENPGVAGLGIFPGEVVKFDPAPGVKVPHMGWNTALPSGGAAWPWEGLPDQPFFYFVHSYFPQPADPALAATETEYAGRRFASSIQKGNLTATQFHPEKSQDNGLRLIGNFVRRCRP